MHRISPLGLLLVSALLGFAGLQLLSVVEGVVLCVLAATVYACGKTFLWPTMLAVVSERFPKGGAITIGAIGGVGMLSAGLLGGPGIGFQQDYNASTKLKATAPGVFDRYKSDKENSFMGFKVVGLDGAKVGVLDDNGKDLDLAIKNLKDGGKSDEKQEKLNSWWSEASATSAVDKKTVDETVIYGGRQALMLTSFVPLTMAGLYLLLILYFKATGGYKAVHLTNEGNTESH